MEMIYNLTQNTVSVRGAVFTPSLVVARFDETVVNTAPFAGVPISTLKAKKATGLPEPSEGNMYIVTDRVYDLLRASRDDLLRVWHPVVIADHHLKCDTLLSSVSHVEKPVRKVRPGHCPVCDSNYQYMAQGVVLWMCGSGRDRDGNFEQSGNCKANELKQSELDGRKDTHV